jgi:hypothetical protein
MEYRAKFISGMKKALYDYTALVVFGEMRHGVGRSTHYNPEVSQGGGRNSSYKIARQYNPTSILMAGEKLFAQKWYSNFGGEKWRNICNRVLLKDTIDDAVYVDMCFSLSHNCSPYLDKCQSNIFCINNVDDYKRTLDFKFVAKNPTKVINECVIFVGKSLKKLVTRAIVLGLISERVQQNTNNYYSEDQWKAEQYILNYKGVEWGDIWLTSQIIKHREGLDDGIFSSLPNYIDPNPINVGDVLEVMFNGVEGNRKIKKGMLVKVVGTKYGGTTLEVIFEENIGGHSLCGKCRDGHGLYLESDYFKKYKVA